MKSLLIEIGTEEIPAGYIEPALSAFSDNLIRQLENARIEHGGTKIMGTPRRLAVMVEGVADHQASMTEEVTGPPEKVGFDENGKSTMAAVKFAEKVGVTVEEIRVTETKKGRYLAATRSDAGVDTASLLSKMLPEIIGEIPFPKSMKWADMNFFFARPVRWIMTLLGERVIPYTIENIQSTQFTFGHRFMKPEIIEIRDPGEYAEKLSSAFVTVDLDGRRKMVISEIEKAAAAMGGKILPDEELIDTVKNLVEYPAAITGRFEEEFLEVPDEVLITAMREHQKYFAVIDDAGKLMPGFIAVNNTRTKDMDLVARGHERVLRARLSDAQFFYRSDRKIQADERFEKLKRVLFQAKLGSMYEKVMRVHEVAEYIAREQRSGDKTFEKEVSRAVRLSKTDLVSHVVVEFPKLQGVMGRVYAGLDREPESVAKAVEEHYRPTYSGGALPETEVGAVTAIADKMDSICGCFSVGLQPTGASDPYALRRQGIGIVQIMLDKSFTFSLLGLIRKSAALFAGDDTQKTGETAQAVYAFFQSRMVNLLAEEGYSKDVILAVTEVSVDHVPNVWNRVKALEKLKADPDFEPLAVAFKRVVNIIRKAGYSVAGEVDEKLFSHESESALLTAYRSLEQKVAQDLSEGRFEQALHDIASIRPTVDAFFDDVMVMAQDQKVRDNRLMMLKAVANLFENFADFSKIST